MPRLDCRENHGKCFYRYKISTHYGNVRAHVNLGGNACSASQTILTHVHHCLPAESSRSCRAPARTMRAREGDSVGVAALRRRQEFFSSAIAVSKTCVFAFFFSTAFSELAAALQRLGALLRKHGRGQEAQVAAVQTLLLSAEFGRALTMHNKVCAARKTPTPLPPPTCADSQAVVRDVSTPSIKLNSIPIVLARQLSG
jgi:hypothetical protein